MVVTCVKNIKIFWNLQSGTVGLSETQNLGNVLSDCYSCCQHKFKSSSKAQLFGYKLVW